MDPRKGNDFIMRLRHDRIYRASEHAHIVVQARACEYFLCLEGNSIQELAQLMASRFEAQSICVQIGPPLFKNSVREPPSGWVPVASDPKAVLYATSQGSLGMLAEFFDRTAHYEQWVFYFQCKNLVDQRSAPKLQYIDLDMLTGRNIPWDALLWYESDSGWLLLLLPIEAKSLDLINELVAVGMAVYPIDDPRTN